MKRIFTLLIDILLFCLLFTGCKAENNVTADGSTSVSKVIGALSETYENETGITVSFNGTGSGSGIQAVLEGRCNIGVSSRNLTENEKVKGLKETILAYDGIAIVVNKENSIENLNIKTIAQIYKGKISNWKELGGKNEKIVLIGRESGSGTRDGFESVTETVGECKYRQELTSSGDVITTVAGNTAAIGYTSLSAVKKTVKIVSVNGVVPTNKAIKNGSYIIKRPFTVITKTGEELNKSAQGFFDFITSKKANKIILFAGAVPAN